MSKKKPPSPFPAEAPSGLYSHTDQEPYPSLRKLPEIDNKAVIVKNLPASYTGDSEHLQLFFESKKRVGRELDVQDVQIVNNAEAVVTFKTAEDANYILQHHKKSPLVIKECIIEIIPSVPRVTVRPKKESTQVKEESQSGNYVESNEVGGFRDCATFEDDYNSVVVTGFTYKVTHDALRYYFENKRKSGGGDILYVQVDREGRKAHITFLEKSDAREVVSRIHKLSDCDLTVVPFITSKVEVLFEDLPFNITEDSLKNYIGAKVRGSEVCTVTFNQNRDKAVVHFAENIDIQKVRDACTKHAIDGHHLKPKSIPVTTSITVFELPEDVTNDHVWYYFENKKRSCGGDVLNIDEHFEDGYCIVSFKQASVVQRVCSKRGGHSLCEVAVQVAPYNHFLGLPFGCDVSSHRDAAVITLGKHFYDTQAVQYTEPSAACGSEDNAIDQYCYNSVEVTGFTDDVTNDTFRYYFENKRKSGGGDILDVQVNREEGVAHIMFKEESDAMEVVSRTHKLNDCDLTVVPFITSKLEVLFEDLPYNITEDSLENYIGAKVRGSEVCKVTFNQNRDKAVVLFAENIDIQKVRDACTKHAIDGHHLKPKCIPVTTSIIVFELSENVTHDSVLYYFEYTNRSCGDDVLNIDEHFEDGYCIVSFKQARVAQRVCSRVGGHSLSGVAVKVALYNRFLGLPFGCEVASHHDALIITLGKESYDSYKLIFLNSNLSIQNETNALLHTCHAIVNDWGNDPIVVESTLTKDEPGYRKLEKEWESNVTKAITGVFDDISVSKRVVAEEAWSAMMKEVRGLKMTYPDDVVFIPEKVKVQVILVARTNKMDCSWKELTAVINRAIAFVKESKEKTRQEVIFSPWKINYIQKSGFLNGFMNVEIAFDEKRGKVIITGNKKDVTDCVLAMYQTIEGTKSKNFEVEPGRSELLKTDRIIKYIGRKMKQQGLSDVWEVEKETVILFGDDENDFDKMENIIRNALGKVSVSLAKAPGDLLSTAKWKTIERDLRQKSKDCLVVEYQRDKKELVIFTTSDMEDQVQDAVEEFCEKNSIYKEEFSVEAPIAQFMEKHLKSNFTGDLDRLKSNGLVKWEVHANGSIKVEGSSESVQKAKEILNGIARSVHCGPLEIQKRFVKHYFESREGHDSLKTVEASVPCVIEERGSNFSKTVRMGKHQAPQQTFDRPTAEVKGPMSGRSSKHAAMPQSPRNTDDDSISFTVYAETSQNVAKAKKQLESTVKTDWKKKEMHDIEIPSLNRYQIKELQDHARNNHCHITIIPEKECIEMVGLVSNISDVQIRVFEILRKVDKYKHERENAEVLASIVQWVIIKEGKQMPFMKNENRLIEQAFKAKEKDIKLKVRQTEYKIDFVSMKEWDISSPKTQYDVLRRDPQKETSVQMPSHWANMRPGELVKTVKLQSSDMEYQKVEKEFLATLAGQHNIASIERVQNPTLYTQYMAKKKQMEIANKGTKMNERMLWHGTAHSAVPSIGAHGFNRFYCGKNLTAIGQGVYFATDANYSAIPTYSPPDSSGYKRMYRCLVLTGEYTTGNDSMRTPPPKNPSSPHILYDSVTNYSQSPSMFVIFNDTQAYPEHLITFK